MNSTYRSILLPLSAALTLTLTPGCGDDDSYDGCITECTTGDYDPCVYNDDLGELLVCVTNVSRFLVVEERRLIYENKPNGAINLWELGDAKDGQFTIAREPQRIEWSTVDGDFVYWLSCVNGDSTLLGRASITMPEVREVFSLNVTGPTNRFAVVDGVVYYSNNSIDGTLQRRPVTGSEESTEIASETLGKDRAIVAADGGVLFNGDDRLLRYDIASGVVSEFATDWAGPIGDLEFTDDSVYWSQLSTLYRCPRSGGAVENVPDISVQGGWTVDDAAFYNATMGQLYRTEFATGARETLASAPSDTSTDVAVLGNSVVLGARPDAAPGRAGALARRGRQLLLQLLAELGIGHVDVRHPAR